MRRAWPSARPWLRFLSLGGRGVEDSRFKTQFRASGTWEAVRIAIITDSGSATYQLADHRQVNLFELPFCHLQNGEEYFPLKRIFKKILIPQSYSRARAGMRTVWGGGESLASWLKCLGSEPGSATFWLLSFHTCKIDIVAVKCFKQLL